MKIRYVDTERLKLERQANKRLFGLYRNPFSHHPCVRAAVDSTANTNLVYWAGKLLGLKESAQPYAVDPDTLETLCYDPFKSPGKTFSAHPKYDPFNDELVVFGYEAKGLGTDDIVLYTIDQQGQIHNDQWVKSPWPAFIHECALTPSFIIFVLWPYDSDVKRMEAGGQHWAYNKDRPTTFVVVPRKPRYRPAGWGPEEKTRVYTWDHALQLHTAGSWEDGDKIFFESSRIYYNVFAVLGDANDKPFGDMEADYVRWEIDVTKPTNTRLPDPEVVLDCPGEMARIDEWFLTKPYDKLFCPVVMQSKECPVPPIMPVGLNAYALLHKDKGVKEILTRVWDASSRSPSLCRGPRTRLRATVGWLA